MTRDPTPHELAIAKATRALVMNGIGVPVSMRVPFEEIQVPVLTQVRLVIDMLRDIPLDLYDEFADDGVTWEDRTSESVFRRYLELVSPPL